MGWAYDKYATLGYQRWRMFWMSCAELFGYAKGQELLVANYRFVRCTLDFIFYEADPCDFVSSLLLFSASSALISGLPSIKSVAHVEYVIATIPTRFEANAWNAVETYELQLTGNIDTAFRFNSGAFEGSVKHIHSVDCVQPDGGNAVWGVQLFWLFRAQYIVA